MENHEFFQNWESRSWAVWGSKLSLSYPSLATEGHQFVDTKLSEPGRESLEFYDCYFDVAQSIAVDLFEIDSENRLDELKKIDGDAGNLLCFRRRFINTWYPELEGIKESFFADVWVVRNASQGSLLDPANLQLAELNLERLMREAYADEYEDFDDGLFGGDSDQVRFSAINWRVETIGEYDWQRYEEYNAHDKLAQVLLYPLGDSHYLKLRLYHMNVREYVEFQALFDVFCKKVTASISLEPLHKIAGIKLSHLRAEHLGMLGSVQEKWDEFDEKARSGRVEGYQDSVPIHRPVPETNHKESGTNWTLLIFASIGFVFALIISGIIKTMHWFTVWEVPYASIIFGIMIASLAASHFLAKISGRLE